MLRGDLSSFSLGEIFQSLAINNHTGTLKISSATQPEKLVFFSQGEISLFSHGSAAGLRIGEVLVRMGAITEDDLVAALEEQRKSRELLGKLLIKKGLVTEDDIRGALRIKIQEEIYDLFLWREGVFEFHMGVCPEDLFDELQKSVTVTINTNSVIMEGLRRLDEWQVLQEKLQTLDEIFIRTDTDTSDLDGIQLEVLGKIDGEQCVREQFQGFYGTRFEYCKIVCELWDGGYIRPLTPREIQHAAAACLGKKKFPQAITFLRYGTQVEPNDPELFESLARALEGVFQENEAREAYLRAARLYVETEDLERAAATAEHLIPGTSLEVQDLQVFFLAFQKTGNTKKAVVAGTQLAQTLQKSGDFQRAAAILEKLSELDSKDLNLKIQVAALLEKAGETERAKSYLEEVAEVLEHQKKYRELVKVLRLLSSMDPEQHQLKERISAVQALLEKLARRKKRRVTIVGFAVIGVSLLSVGPLLYESRAREYFSYAMRVEQVALVSNDFDRAKKAYSELIEKYGFSTKVAEAQSALSRLNQLEGDATRSQDRRSNQTDEDHQARIEATNRSFIATWNAARAAEERGDVQKAHELASHLRSAYGELPASKGVRLPLRITSEPRGATVVLDGNEVGTTPYLHHYDPGTTIELNLTRSSCEGITESVDLEDQWELHFVMNRMPLVQFTAGVTVSQPMVLAGDHIVVPSRDGKVYAIDPLKREAKWERSVGRFGDRVSDLCAVDGEIYLGTVSGEVTALRAVDGQPRWVSRVDSAVLAALALSADRRWLAVGTLAGNAFVFDNKSGKGVARIRTENEIVASPCFLGDLLVVGSTDNHLYGYSLETKGLKFVWELSDDVLEILPLTTGEVAVVTADNRLHRLDTGATRSVWVRPLDEPPSARVALTPHGIHVGSPSGRIVTLDRESGEILSSVSTGQAPVRAIAARDSKVFASLEDGQLAVVDLRERRLLWRYRTGSPLLAPALLLDDLLCIGATSGTAWIFEVVD